MVLIADLELTQGWVLFQIQGLLHLQLSWLRPRSHAGQLRQHLSLHRAQLCVEGWDKSLRKLLPLKHPDIMESSSFAPVSPLCLPPFLPPSLP